MKKNLKNSYEQIDNFFSSAPSTNQKAWGLINEFYHLILTCMEEKNITKAELARRLGKSRSAITQMLNKTPNITIKRMIEIADNVGLDIDIIPKQIKAQKNTVMMVVDNRFFKEYKEDKEVNTYSVFSECQDMEKSIKINDSYSQCTPSMQ